MSQEDSFRIPFFAFALVACGGAATTPIGGDDASRRDDAAAIGADAPLRSGDAAAEPDAGRGGTIQVHLKATTAPFAHHDAWAGQTPSDQRIGIRSLTLGASADDPSPWVVFDLGTKAVDSGLNDLDDTLVATLPASSLRSGSYRYAHVGVAYVRYAVSATVHADGLWLPGTFDNLEVLSNDTRVGSQTLQSGDYSFTFLVGSQTYGPITGTSAPLPASDGLGIALSIRDGQASYGFPVTLDVEATSADVVITMLANTSEDFRWMDQSDPGYQDGVFDVTPPASYEPVEQFGANRLTLSVTVGR
jgi:hypothetical protein